MEAYLSTPFAGATCEAQDGDGEPEEDDEPEEVGESPAEAAQEEESEGTQEPGPEEAP
jgi:hypothetical protein